ncbi:MAG: hypothetical protein WC556_14025 [Candidatus Methanoperedens sp.]
MSIFIIILFANVAFGYAGMGNISTSPTPDSQLEQSVVTSISEIYGNPANYINNVKVTGKIVDFINVQNPPSYTTYMKIDDGTGSLWVANQANEPLNIQIGMELTAEGFMMNNFRSNSTGMTYDLIIFTTPDKIVFTTTPIQQETGISWLESMVNSILDWIKSFF